MSTLLSKEFLRRLDGMSMLLKRPVSGHLRGQHRSKRTGFGMVFTDYRPYSPGDDVRNMDWATYMRLDRLVLRMFEEEADTPIYIFVDNSSSMGVDGSEKLNVAKKFAALLTYVGLLNHDRVSLIAFSDNVIKEMPGRRGKNQMWRAIHFLESLKTEGRTSLEKTFRRFFGGKRTRGLVFVISDFLVEEELEDSFRTVVQYGHDVLAAHVLAPTDTDPDINGQVVLIDSESKDTINTGVSEDILRKYRLVFAEHRDSVEKFFRRSGWGYVPLNTELDFERSVIKAIKAEGAFR